MVNIDRNRIRKEFDNNNMAIRYNQFIKYITDDLENGLDETEYRVFKEMTLKKDIYGLAQGLVNNIFTFDEYYDKLQLIVGWDLMIQGIFSGNLKLKNNV